ncbi:hypothetical protein BH18ACT3_BH18ACT3_23800 [soil metagenome]
MNSFGLNQPVHFLFGHLPVVARLRYEPLAVHENLVGAADPNTLRLKIAGREVCCIVRSQLRLESRSGPQSISVTGEPQ